MVETIRNKRELKDRLVNLYVIRDYMDTKEQFIEFQEYFYDIIRGCYEHLALRDYPIYFKFYNTDSVAHQLPLRLFVIHLFYWYPFTNVINFRNVMTDEYIMKDIANDIPKIDDWINKLIYMLGVYNIKSTITNYDISFVLKNLRRISGDFSTILGLNFDMITFFDMFNNIPEFREIVERPLPDGLQPAEIEKIFEDELIKLVDLLKSIEDNPIGIILRSGTGIKSKQLAEFLVMQALKPTIEGTTIPIPISNSTVIGGLETAADRYIDGTAARKSVIMSHKTMGTAGHFAKILAELARTISLSKTVHDCGSRHLEPYEIKTKKHLKYFNGKFYSMESNDLDGLRILDSSKDSHLIGKTIYARSIATCALDDGHFCATCMGSSLAALNFDIADGVSAFIIKEMSKHIEQNILSTKHILTTISEKVEFNTEFNDFFYINSDEIVPVLDNPAINIEDWVIECNRKDIIHVDEMDDDEGYNTFIHSGAFRVRNTVTGQIINMIETGGKALFISDGIVKEFMTKCSIPFKGMVEDTEIFVIQIVNNELTKPLYNLMDLITKDIAGETKEISSLCQKFIDLYVEAGINSIAASAEIIVNRLTRSLDDIHHRPSFKGLRLPDYRIVTLVSALENHPSITVGLSFQYLKRQFLSDETFEKTAPSYLDPLYMEHVSAKKWKDRHTQRQLFEDKMKHL